MKKLYLLLSVLFLIGCTEKNPINIDLLRSSKDHSIYYSKETNEPYSGPVFYLDENDNIFLQGSLKNGEKNGKWIYWNRYGNKIEGIVSEKVSSTFTGVMFDFFNFNNEMFVSYFSYEKGIKEGPHIHYLEDDWLKENGFYKSSVREEGSYKKGIKEGPFIWDVESGEFEGAREEGTFKNGVREGPFVYYLSSGSRSEGTLKNGVKEGAYVYYFISGSREEGTYKHDVKEGSYVDYFSSGDREEGTFKNGVKEGPYVYYFSNGIREEGN